jgi:hypothetical protein
MSISLNNTSIRTETPQQNTPPPNRLQELAAENRRKTLTHMYHLGLISKKESQNGIQIHPILQNIHQHLPLCIQNEYPVPEEPHYSRAWALLKIAEDYCTARALFYFADTSPSFDQITTSQEWTTLADSVRHSISKFPKDDHAAMYLDDLQLPLIPREILQFKKLKLLDLSHNHLRMLPQWISEFPFLTELNCSSNEMVCVASRIGKLTQLRILNVSHNRLTNLPNNVGCLRSLQHLNAQDNQLSTLPPHLHLLTNLQDLNISVNNFSLAPLVPLNADVDATNNPFIKNAPDLTALRHSTPKPFLSETPKNFFEHPLPPQLSQNSTQNTLGDLVDRCKMVYKYFLPDLDLPKTTQELIKDVRDIFELFMQQNHFPIIDPQMLPELPEILD